jgi:hypothetical protein
MVSISDTRGAVLLLHGRLLLWVATTSLHLPSVRLSLLILCLLLQLLLLSKVLSLLHFSELLLLGMLLLLGQHLLLLILLCQRFLLQLQ